MLEQIQQVENSEGVQPLSVQELLGQAIQDATLGESAEFVADDFFKEFVHQNREETSQILQMLDMPNEVIINALIQSQLEAIEIFKRNVPKFLNELRSEVQKRLAEMQTHN